MHPFWISLILGIVEGLTEFLPVSSTGHLILTSEAIGFESSGTFEIVIQLGAILAVVWEHRRRLISVVRDLPRTAEARGFTLRLLLAFLPSAILGVSIYPLIKGVLFTPLSVSLALIVGAVMILIVESLPLRQTTNLDTMTWRHATAIGFAQCLSLWSGFSRSAATILGGLVIGLDRRSATEFSFFLAIPTMFAAASYDLYKSHDTLHGSDWLWLGVSFVVSFLVAWVSIRWLLRFVATHTFRVFAWYRLALGLVFLYIVTR